MEASLNIVESLKQDDLKSQTDTASTTSDIKTGQIQTSTKKETCKKINANKKTF
jgi:hypothetical protein